MPKYNVLAEVTILEAVRLPGETIEIASETAGPFVADAKLALINDDGSGEAPAPAATTDDKPPADGAAQAKPPEPPAAPEEPPVNTPPAFGAPPAPVHQPEAPAEKPWVGGHTISG